MESTFIDSDAYSLFEPPNQTGTPERRLLLAILERAILDFVGNDSKEVCEAQEWLFNYQIVKPYEDFSFPWVCDQLDLDLNKISQKIRKMPKRGNRRVAPWYLNKPFTDKKEYAKAS